MSRNEIIYVSLGKSNSYSSTIQALKNDAKSLQEAFGSIKVGDSVKALKDQATASKEAARAAQEASKAEREAANAEKARYQAVKELENATKAHLQAEREAQNVVTAQVKTEKEAYNAIKSKEQAERAAIQTQKAQLSLTKQQVSAHRSLSDSLRSLTLQFISFQRATQTIRYALNEMKDMSDEMAIYRKVTNATAQDMERIRAVAYETAKAYGQSASDVIASAANMARAGYRENSVAMAELATRTQLVGDMTADAASKFLIATDAAYKYQGNVEKLSAVLDAANEIDNNYATSIEKISEGMTLVASLGASAHVPIEQMIAALGTMTAVTQRSGSEVARGLRSIILNVLGDTTTEIEEGVTATTESVKSMTDALMKYGDESVKASIKAGKMINPMEAIVALQKAWKNNQISEADLFQISNDVAGKRYYNVFTALIQNPEMYNSMIQDIANSTGSAQREIDALMESWSKKLERLKTTWTEIVNKSISEGFIKDLIDGGTAALEFAGSLENLAIMAGGALTAIRSLSAGITNLRGGNAFGGFNIATSVLGLAIGGIGAWKSAYEQNIRRMQEEAAKAIEESVAETSTLTTLYTIQAKYSEIAKDGIQEEKGELTQLKSLQDELNGLVGDQAGAIDLVNGKYEDTLTALRKITEEQRQAALEQARTALTTANAAFSQADFNGAIYSDFLENHNGYSVTNIPVGFGGAKVVRDWFEKSKYFRQGKDWLGQEFLDFRKPASVQERLDFYQELIELYSLLGTTTKAGKTAGRDEQTLGEEYAKAYSELGKFVNTVKESADPLKTAYDVFNALLHPEDFEESATKTAIEEIGEAAETASDSISGMNDSVDSLTDSIDKATKAKNLFDEAMKTTKADAFGEYMAAFETFKSELDAGRINSTAMYAAARMMLGTDAYNATGGTYAGVTEALNRRGSAGSVLDAYTLLNQQYVDANGKDIAGFGVYELIRKSGVLSENSLRDASGNYYIPDLTGEQISQISAAYGGILGEVIINALNALDQYDINGSATDENVFAGAGESKTVESQEELSNTAEKASESLENLSAAAEEEKKTIEDDGAGERVAQSAAYADAQSQREQEEARAAAEAKEEERLKKQQEILKTAQDAYTAVDKLVENLSSINALESNPVLADIISNLEYLEREHQIDIQTGDATKVTQETVAAIEWAIQQITEGKNKGTIDVELADNAIAVLTEQLATAVTAMEQNAGLADVEVHASADTKEAESDLDELAERDREAIINAELGGEGQFESKVADLTKKETKFVEITDNGTAKDTEDKATATGAKLDAVITKLGTINETPANPHIIALINGLNGIKEKYTFAIEATGTETLTAQQKLQAISSALNEIDNKKDLAISVGLPGVGEALESAKQQLIAEANGIISSVEDSDELHDLTLTTVPDGGTFNSDILTLIAEAEKNKAGISVELKNAVPTAQTLQLIANPTGGRKAEVNVEVESGSETAFNEKIADLTKPATKSIIVKTISGAGADRTGVSTTGGTPNYGGPGVGLTSLGGGSPAFGGGGSVGNYFVEQRDWVPRWASGTRSHPGGVALVNDGSGPELLVSGGRAFVANHGRPALVSLEKGARVFSASETRQIFGGGLPAYADGAGGSGSISSLTLRSGITVKPSEITGNDGNKESSSGAALPYNLSNLKELIDYVIDRIGIALDEQVEIIDKQINELKAQRKVQEQEDELLKKQKDVADAMNERTVRYIDENGQWHWMADQNKVRKAQDALRDYEDELAFNSQIQALEDQKTALQDEYKQITKTWSDIQYAMNTPTGNLNQMLSMAIAKGTGNDKKAAQTVQSLLIGKLLQGGSFQGNYSEALDSIARASSGNAIMPGESNATLASLIATTRAIGTGTEIVDSMKSTAMAALAAGANGGLAGNGTQTNFNYFINGIRLGADQENQPLSSIMRNLTVYTNTGVA